MPPISWQGPMIFIPMILLSVSIPVLVLEWEAGRKGRFRAVTLWMCDLMLALSLPHAVVFRMRFLLSRPPR